MQEMELKGREGELESAFVDVHIDGALAQTLLELLCERTNTDLEAFKKEARWASAQGAIRRLSGTPGVTVARVSARVGMSRQNYYKQRKSRARRAVDEELVIELVVEARKEHPRIGGRKLYHLLDSKFVKAGVKVGRDRLFDIMRGAGMLVEPLPKSPRTTDSRHTLPVFRNLIAEVEPTGPNQIWVSDITYIRTDVGFEYLSLIMDMYSRKVVGFHCGDDLSTTGCLASLKQALSGPEGSLIHHSDRGSQYCSHAYVNQLKEHGVSVSMTEENHCAENSMAERLNGILKQEYGLGGTFRSRAQARRAVRQAVRSYNNRRPHMSLNLQTPAEVHRKAA